MTAFHRLLPLCGLLLLALNVQHARAVLTYALVPETPPVSPLAQLPQPFIVVENSTNQTISNVACTITGTVANLALVDVNTSFTGSAWYFNGARIDNGSRGFTVVTSVSTLFGVNQQVLSILSWPATIPLSLAGNYVCRLDTTPTSSVLPLHVAVRARITFANETLNSTLNQPAVLRCDVVGDDPINTTWFKNGVAVATSSGSATELVLAGVRSDTAMYTCRTFNLYANDSTRSLNVTIHERPSYEGGAVTATLLNASSNTAYLTLAEPVIFGNLPVNGYRVTCIPRPAYASFIGNVSEDFPGQGLQTNLTGLHPGVSYGCTFQARNNIGLSDPVNPTFVKTIDLPSAGPSVVARFLSSTALEITYMPPAANMTFGDITAYRLEYNRSNCNTPDASCPCALYTCDLDNFTRISSGSAGSINITGLRRYTNYSISVQAENGAGLGMVTEINARTDEHLAGEPRVTAITHSETTIIVNWEAPREPNGAVLSYQVTYSAVGVNETMVVVDANDRQFNITGQMEDTAFEISLRAVNMAGLGQLTVLNQSTATPPRIITTTSLYILEAFKPGSLPCRILRGLPAPNITWTSPLLSGPRPAEADGSLLLSPVPINGSGSYTCTASNAFGSENFTVTLSSIVTPTVSIAESVAATSLTGEALYQLRCTVTGSPIELADVTWSRSAAALSASFPVPFAEENLIGTASSMRQSDQVMEIVRTVMVQGNRNYACTVTMPSVRSDTVNVDWNAPTAMLMADRESLDSGGNATVLCTATGSPSPLVRILRNGVELAHNVSLVMNTVEASYVTLSGGTFVCIASNRAGAQNSTVVIDTPQASESQLIPGLENLYFYIIFGGIGLILIVFIIVLICRGHKRRQKGKTYRVRDDLRSFREPQDFHSPAQRHQSSRPVVHDQSMVYPNEMALNQTNNGGVSGYPETGFAHPGYTEEWTQDEQDGGAPDRSTFQPNMGGATMQQHPHHHQQQQQQQPDFGGEGKVYYDEFQGYPGGAPGYNTVNEYRPDRNSSRTDMVPQSAGYESDGNAQGNREALPTFTARHGDHILTAL